MVTNYNKLKKEQQVLSEKIRLFDNFEKIHFLGGVDILYTQDKLVASIVVIDLKNKRVIEHKSHVSDSSFPYIPGLAFYRFGSAVIEAYQSLNQKPDLLICNFGGSLHPRGIGPASQLGLILDVPTIGISDFPPCGEKRDHTYYQDKEPKGVELVTKVGARPIIISPGYRISLTTSKDIVKEHILPPHKLPEPIHIAHKLGLKIKKSLPQ